MSVIIASVLLPFLPETPIQLLVEGLLYDFGQLTLPFDNVDKETIVSLINRIEIIDSESIKIYYKFSE